MKLNTWKGDTMKVKVGDVVYDSKDTPVMVILTQQDKENIKDMAPEATKYCTFPDGMYSADEILEWMNDEG